MTARNVTDADGRVWECRADADASEPGKDVDLVCTTGTVKAPLRLKVSWNWMKMADKGLARLIAAAVPVPTG
jgi:hypothetical protein